MNKTILITGTSTGIGLEISKLFATKQWNVIATMRNPEKDAQLKHLKNITLLPLDVTDVKSIEVAIAKSIALFGKIDIIVNNAGYALAGAFEAMSSQQIRKQFDTNLFGVMNVTRAILPHFRLNKSGCIINITSMGGLITFPIWSVYHSTKWAVEGFMESLQYELRPYNIRIKNIEPGAIQTEFENSIQLNSMPEYDTYVSVTNTNMMANYANAPKGEVVAQKVFEAANDYSYSLRYAVSLQSKMLLLLRRFLPNSWFFFLVRNAAEKGLKK